jgi:hypothetical protein
LPGAWWLALFETPWCARQSPAVSRVVELLHQSLAQGGYIMYIIMWCRGPATLLS